MNSIAKFLVGLIAGTLFGLGLVISEMTNPARILGFLDFFGHWDPRLAFVMVGAIAVHAPFAYWLRRRGKPFIEKRLCIPTQTQVDKRLVIGAMLFGIGWGLAGYCPGPAVVSATRGGAATLLVVSMVVGMWLFEATIARHSKVTAHPPSATGLGPIAEHLPPDSAVEQGAPRPSRS